MALQELQGPMGTVQGLYLEGQGDLVSTLIMEKKMETTLGLRV